MESTDLNIEMCIKKMKGEPSQLIP